MKNVDPPPILANPILARDGSLQLSLVILIKEFTKRIFSDLHQ